MSAVPSHWIPHRREDGEVIGWIDLESQEPDLIPIDRLGRPLPSVSDWNAAEEVLDDVGLRFLMNRFHYRGHTVRIRHLYEDRVIVTTAVSDAIGDVGQEFTLPFPAGPDLTEIRTR
ncbi:hypothetical protein [Rhodococcus artemisiae]|uniref:PAS domain-containing protein n=1 Tax=Rhodococcus artemisiae TaxID=714159 RepID=A0ABU7L8U3_9NOCA|nr:hypothetical protein [Rhodococcus artemisiae]MEE2057969.1 hypothetical protein [Rhodococcus artemisiae]